MKNKLHIYVILFSFIFLSGNLFAQMDARQLPHFLRSDWFGQSPQKIGKFLYKYTELPPLVGNEKVKDRIQADGFEIVNISGTSGHQSETWITYNPNNPNMIVGSANDYRYNYPGAGYRMAAYCTTDGGKNWVVTTTPKNMDAGWIDFTGNMTNFDPGVAFDLEGNCYYSYGYCQVTDEGEDDNGVFVSRSPDGGFTWEAPMAVAYTISGTSTQPFHDRYSIACDVYPDSSKFNNRIYVTWQRFKQSPGVCISYSTDQGENWSSANLIPGGSGTTQSPVPTVGPNGELYVVWQNKNTDGTTSALVQKSVNGGKSWWTGPKTAQTVKTLGTVNTSSGRNVLADKQSMRVSSVANLAVDCSNGPRRGWVYVVQAGKDATSKHRLFFTRSENKGDTWTATKGIDDNALGNDIFFPSIAVDPITGLVAVLYYTSQNDPENKGVDAYLAVSFDGGETFKNIRITPTTWYINDANDVSFQGTGNYYWGDYTSITAYNGKIYPCFWMPTSSSGNFSSVASFVALMSTGPKPPQNVTAENNYQEPNKVTVRWVDPQYNQLGGELGDFTIAVYRGDTKIGDVNKGTLVYVDNGAEDGKEFTYKLKTVTIEGESEFATVTGIAGGALQPMAPEQLIAKPVANGILLQWKNPSKHTDNSYLHDFNKIYIYKNGEKSPSFTIEGQQIQAGETVSTVIDLPVKTFYKIAVSAVGKRGEILTESSQTTQILAYSGAPYTEVNETFDDSENLMPRFTTAQWAITNKVSKSTPNCITDSPDGNYSDRTVDSLVFAPFVVPAATPTISFDNIALIDKGGDYGILSVTNDFGQTWKDILYIDMSRSEGFTDDVLTSTWIDEHRTLSDYIGDTVFIKFTLTSNAFRTKDGWYIDNIRLDDNENYVDENLSIDNLFDLNIYPNPINDVAQINLKTYSPGNVIINIYDALGNKIQSIANNMIYAGFNNYTIDLSRFAESVYYCNISFNGITRTLPLVVVR